jgi:hypothetical protein
MVSPALQGRKGGREGKEKRKALLRHDIDYLHSTPCFIQQIPAPSYAPYTMLGVRGTSVRKARVDGLCP